MKDIQILVSPFFCPSCILCQNTVSMTLYFFSLKKGMEPLKKIKKGRWTGNVRLKKKIITTLSNARASLLNFYRLSPFEWENPTPWTESDEIEYDCTLHNCFWHNWGSLMQQGSDICPRYTKKSPKQSVKIFASAFFFFFFFLCCSAACQLTKFGWLFLGISLTM